MARRGGAGPLRGSGRAGSGRAEGRRRVEWSLLAAPVGARAVRGAGGGSGSGSGSGAGSSLHCLPTAGIQGRGAVAVEEGETGGGCNGTNGLPLSPSPPLPSQAPTWCGCT